MRKLFLPILMLASVSQSASAQLFQPIFIPATLSGQMNQLISVQTQQRQSDKVQVSENASVSSTSLSFRQLPERTRVNLAQFVAKSRAVNPQSAAAMAQLFASTDIIAVMGQELVRYGLRTDNVADCYAVWWMSAWQAANGDTSDVPLTTAQFVKRQSARALIATPQFASVAEAQKQEYAEALLVQAALLSASAETYKTDPAMMRKLATSVRAGAKSSGLDLDTMWLTPNGFFPTTPVASQTKASASKNVKISEASRTLQGDMIWSKTHMTIFRQWGDLQYHPTVLFADGTSMDIDDASLETTDLTASRVAHPTAWGYWRREGSRYFLTDDQGNTSDYGMGDGGLFRTFSAASGTSLSGRYKSVSGSTMGEMSTLSTSGITFASDGRFTMRNSFLASGSGAHTGVSIGGGGERGFDGRYTLSANRIIMRFNDGDVKDLFFAFGSAGTSPRPDHDMIFLGFTAYVLGD